MKTTRGTETHRCGPS